MLTAFALTAPELLTPPPPQQCLCLLNIAVIEKLGPISRCPRGHNPVFTTNKECDMNESGSGVTRRDILLGGAGYAALTGIAPLARAESGHATIDFSDPVEELRAHVKLVGSLQKETVISFLRLNIYADSGEGNFAPLFTLNNLLIDHWEPQGNDEYQMTKYEAGYYSELDSYRPLESYENPFTK